jgi:hypothetical protein
MSEKKESAGGTWGRMTALSLIAALSVKAYHARNQIETMLTQPTPVESALLDTLYPNVLSSGTMAWLDCDISGAETSDSYGYVVQDPHLKFMYPVIHVRKEDVCDEAMSYIGQPDKSWPSIGQAWAIMTLVHEGQHLETGSIDDAEVSCYTIQKIGAYAASLGANEVDIELLEDVVHYVYNVELPDDYKSPECRPGGKYDLHLPEPTMYDYE